MAENKKPEDKKKFTIHVVNSVKGGSGKSTFCLFLENYLLEKARKNKEKIDDPSTTEEEREKLKLYKPIIVDLDLSGSSWYRNNEDFLISKDFVYINDLVENFDRNIAKDYIFNIRTHISDINSANVRDRNLEIVMSDPERAGEIKDEQLDLFENAIYKLIKTLVDNNKKTDIILDMPPGYEDYTERIVKHLLFDLKSPLYTEYVLPKSNKTDYCVKFYMLSGIDGAIGGNIKYIDDFYNKANYSCVTEMLESKDINFIIDDIENAYGNFASTDPKYNAIIKGIKKDNSTNYNFHFISHIGFNHVQERVKNFLTSGYFKKLNIEYYDTGSFGDILDKVIDY